MPDVAARPFAFPLRMKEVALIVIDMQRDFVEPGGFGASLGNDVAALKTIVPVVADLLALFRNRNLPVFHTRECHKADLSDCPPAKRNRGNPQLRIGDNGPMGRILVAGEYGTGIVSDLMPIASETVIDKPGKGAFYNTPLATELANRGVTQLVVAGVTTEVCVQSTIREANDRGFECLLITDATESYFPAFKQATIEMLTAQNAISGWATTSNALREALA